MYAYPGLLLRRPRRSLGMQFLLPFPHCTQPLLLLRVNSRLCRLSNNVIAPSYAKERACY